VAIDWGEPTLWGAERNHVHLRLTAVLPPQQRRKPRQGGSSGPLLHPDRGQHTRNIKQQLATMRERHKRRAKIFGIDPDLVPRTFPTRGNIGPASVPFTLAGEVETLSAGDRVLLMGIGSGLNVSCVELDW